MSEATGPEVCDNCGDEMRDGRPCDCQPEGGRCNLCNEDMPSPFGPVEMLDHLRVHHPDQYDEVERWPDGGVVVHEGDIDAGVAALLESDER